MFRPRQDHAGAGRNSATHRLDCNHRLYLNTMLGTSGLRCNRSTVHTVLGYLDFSAHYLVSRLQSRNAGCEAYSETAVAAAER